MKRTITVCLCTFRRPSVADTLQSMSKQIISEEIALDIVVVDSDQHCSARTLVELIANQITIPVRYVVADGPGVAAARNKAIEQATGDWLAFIDDDEVAGPTWIKSLQECAVENCAQVVFGSVLQNYSVNCPHWIKTYDLFGRVLQKTGTVVLHGPSGNAFVQRLVLSSHEHRFDPAYGTTGGEDTDFFYRLSKQGIRMVTCREAVVYESLEEHRLNRNYLLRKAVRVGETYYRIFIFEMTSRAKFIVLTRVCMQFLVASGIAAGIRPFSIGRSMLFQIKAAANLGKLRAALGCPSLEMYKG